MAEARAGSLRRHLLGLLLGSVALAWAVTAVMVYFDARAAGERILDASLREAGELLLAFAEHEVAEGANLEARSGRTEVLDVESPILHQIWDRAGRLLYHSDGAPSTALAAAPRGFSEGGSGGLRWRAYAQWDPSGNLQVQVAQALAYRDGIATDMAWRLVLPLLLLLPILGLLVWVSVGRGVEPVRRLAGEIGARSDEDLRRVDASDAPEEIRPLADALNRMFERVARTLDNERSFTADAAHELLGPLSALRVQAGIALEAPEASKRAEALRGVMDGVDRASALVSQLLALARLESVRAAQSRRAFDLAELAFAVADGVEPEARAKGQRLDLDIAPASLEGDPEAVAILLRNLLDNAVRYTQDGGRIGMRLATGADGIELAVSDDGPGIPAGERERVFDRFYRAGGGIGAGSGLGLSIARRVAELHGGTVRLDDGPGGRGLTVRVHFPVRNAIRDRPAGPE